MASYFPDPLAPETVNPTLLATLTEIHGTVRQWLEDSAVALKNEHVRANLPYVDLMFAFGFATLGDHASAGKLVQEARRVLEGPIPPQRDPRKDPDPVVARLLRDIILKAFEFRIEQALAGKPHAGRLSLELLAELEEIRRKAHAGAVNNPYKLAVLVIDRMREQSEIIEPEEKPDPYTDWTKHGDPLKKELADLSTIREPVLLAERIHKLHEAGVRGKKIEDVRLFVLHDAIPLSPRVGEVFAVELLTLVPAALAGGTRAVGYVPSLPWWQGRLLVRAILLAEHFNRSDLVKQMVDQFTTLVQSHPEEARFRLINVVAGDALRTLKKLGLNDDADRFLGTLRDEVLRGETLAELRKRYASRPDTWGNALQTLVNLACGWLMFGRKDQTELILAEARNELLGSKAVTLQKKDYTALAQTYVRALAETGHETGLNRIIELFREMPRTKITNTWTTAQYYSRFHMNLVEETVAAVCRMLAEPRPHVVG